MSKVKVFLICLAVIISIFASIVSLEMYTLERAVARGFFIDILDEMQDVGYLDQEIEAYYRAKMLQMGWESSSGDFFAGSWPRAESSRARKERQEMVSLTMRMIPSPISRWIHFVREGSGEITFSSTRPSEYFDPGW